MARKRTILWMVAAAALLAVAGTVAVAQNFDPVEEIFANEQNETSKEEIIEEDATLIAIAEANSPAPVPDNPEAAAPSPDPEDVPTWEEGIFKGGEDFPSGAGYDFNTTWQGTEAGLNVRVYAGAYAESNETGIVLVDYVDPATWEHSFKGPFEAPIPGPLQIVDAKGTILTLSGANGSTTFDVSTLEFG